MADLSPPGNPGGTVSLPPARTARGHFFRAFAGVLLLVLVGFAHTFYLRSWFTDEPLALPFVLHGITLSAWFVLFFVLSLQARRGNIALHCRPGWLGAAVVALAAAQCSPPSTDVACCSMPAGTALTPPCCPQLPSARTDAERPIAAALRDGPTKSAARIVGQMPLFVNDSPMTISGKVQKFLMREAMAKRLPD